MWPFDSSTQTPPRTASASASASACPVDHDARQEWLGASSSETTTRTSRPRAPAPPPLSEDREVSSIPRWLPPSRSDSPPPAASPPSACPAHDPNFNQDASLNSAERAAIVPSESNWVYPSPSSFYRALAAKDRNPNPNDMDIVVPIHNAVNERVWQQVLEWERHAQGLAPGQDPGVKLVSFIGRPRQMSPRARWKSLIGYTAPFDRHDWIIDRPVASLDPRSNHPDSATTTSPPSGTPESIRVRYVIDFYTGRGANLLSQSLPPPPSGSVSSPSTTPATSSTAPSRLGPGPGAEESVKMPNLAFFIDCRPALDDWEGVRMRFSKYWGIGGTPDAPASTP